MTALSVRRSPTFGFFQPRHWKMRTKFAALVIAIATITVLCTAVATYYSDRQSTLDRLGGAYNREAELTSGLVFQLLQSNMNTLRLLALSPELVAAAESSNRNYMQMGEDRAKAETERIDQAWIAKETSVNNLIHDLQNSSTGHYLAMAQVFYPEQVEIFATDQYGRNIAMTGPTSDYYQADEEWWQIAYAQGKGDTYFGSLIYDESSQKWAINMAVPIRSPNTQHVQGILRSTVDVSRAMRILDRQRDQQGAQMAMLSKDGKIIYETTRQSIGQATTPELTSFLATGRTIEESITDWLGRRAFLASYPIQSEISRNIDWVLLTSVPRDVIDRQIAQLLLPTLIIGFGIAILMSLVGFWLARTITQPLIVITQQASHLAAGEILSDDRSRALSRYQEQRDEMGDLARAFRSLSNYMAEMAGHAQQIAAGHLIANIRPQSDADVLGMSFAQMLQNLRSLIGQVQHSAVDAAAASQQLNHASEQVGYASHQIAETIYITSVASNKQVEDVNRAKDAILEQDRAIEVISARAANQAEATHQASHTLHMRLSPAIEQVVNSTRRSNEAVQGAGQAVRLGASTVVETISDIKIIAQSTESVGSRVDEMEQRADEIGSIVETIQEIADRTNLLALNAAIEAARAGDHGRGFAVVADEVRKLAEQSSKSARQITSLVKAVQKSAQDAATAMTQSQRQVNQGLANAAKTDAVFSQIDQTVEQVDQEITLLLNAIGDMRNSSEVLAEMMEQLSGDVHENAAVVSQIQVNSRDVLASIEDLLHSASANSSAAVEMSAAAEEVSAQVEETVASAESLAQMAEQLMSLVGKFTVEEDLEKEALDDVDIAEKKEGDDDETDPQPVASDVDLSQTAHDMPLEAEPVSLNGSDGHYPQQNDYKS